MRNVEPSHVFAWAEEPKAYTAFRNGSVSNQKTFTRSHVSARMRPGVQEPESGGFSRWPSVAAQGRSGAR